MIPTGKKTPPSPGWRTLCAARGRHLLSAPGAPELLPDTQAFPKPGSRGHWPQGGLWMWLVPGRLRWRLGGVLAWAQHRELQCPREALPRTRRRESLALGENYANDLSGSCFENTQLLVHRKLSWGNFCSLPGSDSPFYKHWKPEFHHQPPI